MKNKVDYKELKEIDSCITDIETLIALDKRAVKDFEENTHEIGQEEIITLIREFIRCKNDYLKVHKTLGEANRTILRMKEQYQK